MLNVALDCIRRGWHVFPCVPRDKQPLGGLAPHGVLDASNDEAVIRRWWTAKPDANVGIACGPSGLVVVDIDHGLKDDGDFLLGFGQYGDTYTVRTGRRPEFGVQLYYQADTLRNSAGWEHGGCSGDVRGAGGYVLAAGSVHPSGEKYTVLVPAPVAPMPDWVRELAPVKEQFDPATAVDDSTADEWKAWLLEYAAHHGVEVNEFEKRVPNGWWLGIRCPWEHRSGDGVPSSTVLGILDGRIAFECSHGTCKAAKRDTAEFKREMYRLHGDYGREPGLGPSVSLGNVPKGGDDEKELDWRELFHNKGDVLNCPPPTFFIQDFLAKQAICALAAPVAQRKSLIALNVARSLCDKSRPPLFGFLQVVHQPKRVLYLCPEMGLISMSERIRKIGLVDAVGETLFIRSMNLGNLDLAEIPDEALEGSVLIVDTAIRFMKGDENSSADMQAFSEVLFSVQRRQGPSGAIVVLYHSPKATKDASELTLENCMRGSGELGAAITDAHGTRLQSPDDPYNSASFIRHIKPRDYQGVEDFEVTSDIETGVLTRVGGKAVLAVHVGGNKSNKDGKDDAALALMTARLTANPDVTIDALQKELAEGDARRSTGWISKRRKEIILKLRGAGSRLEG